MQGTQQLFAALSQGQLLDMVDKMVMIAPVAYVKHVNAPLAELAASMYIDRVKFLQIPNHSYCSLIAVFPFIAKR
jgi:lysosomal acid lipase/cholesteryl ester hydrolase